MVLKKVLSEIEHQMRLAVQALGLDNCSVNADVFVDGERVSIIEIGGRTGATCIPGADFPCTMALIFYEKILQTRSGSRYSLKRKNRAFFAWQSF